MRSEFILFIITTILMGTHVIYGTLQVQTSLLFSFTLFVFPYLVIAAFWMKLKEIYKLSITIVLIILEMNHAATDTIPGLVKKGFNTYTLDALFYLPCILLLFAILIILFIRRLKKSRDDKNHPFAK